MRTDIFKFARFVDDIFQNASDKIFCKTKGIRGLEFIEVCCVPNYDPESKEQIEEESMFEITLRNGNSLGEQEQFLMNCRQHCYLIIEKCDDYREDKNSVPAARKYMEKCASIAWNLLDDIEAVAAMFPEY